METQLVSKEIYPIGLISDFKDILSYRFNAENLSKDLLCLSEKKPETLLFIDSNTEFTTVDRENIVIKTFGKVSSESNVFPLSTEVFESKYKDKFEKIIKNTHFVQGEDNFATLMFSDLLREDKYGALSLINRYFVDNFEDAELCVKILTMLNDYSYEELSPFSQTLAIASLTNKHSRVISAALNLFGHWGNKKALELIQKIDIPQQPWIMMKYNAIKKSLEERWCSYEK